MSFFPNMYGGIDLLLWIMKWTLDQTVDGNLPPYDNFFFFNVLFHFIKKRPATVKRWLTYSNTIMFEPHGIVLNMEEVKLMVIIRKTSYIVFFLLFVPNPLFLSPEKEMVSMMPRSTKNKPTWGYAFKGSPSIPSWGHKTGLGFLSLPKMSHDNNDAPFQGDLFQRDAAIDVWENSFILFNHNNAFVSREKKKNLIP